MMRRGKFLAALLLALVGGWTVAQDEVAYYQSAAFNVPILAGWQDQSAEGAAQYHLEAEQATIRVAMVDASDAQAGAEADLRRWLGANPREPVYSGKVNLADGTWRSLVYDLDESTTASVMARRAGERVIVISFLESDPSARTLLLTVARADDTPDDASREIADAALTLAGIDMTALAPAGLTALPSGEWVAYETDSVAAMGMVFGNDSYVALREGAPGDLAALADAYIRALLGFFITPDNSLYLALGLAASFLILALLAGSFAWRARNLRKDLALIAQLQRKPD